jgi:hypothetical protein
MITSSLLVTIGYQHRHYLLYAFICTRGLLSIMIVSRKNLRELRLTGINRPTKDLHYIDPLAMVAAPGMDEQRSARGTNGTDF